jgi:hypothetical protein
MLAATAPYLPSQPCRIEIIEAGDASPAWPVPGVELRTIHGVRFVSDNAGLIAFDLPELMGRETWLSLHGHGYSLSDEKIKKSMGFCGVCIVPAPGKTITVAVERRILAHRLGRVTGGGLFAEARKLGLHVECAESGVLGADSVVTAELCGRTLWLWGDTRLVHHPLGIFNVSAAWTQHFQPPLIPPLCPPFEYISARSAAHGEMRPRGVAAVPGDGPTWIWGAVTLPDSQGTPHLVATAVKVRDKLHQYRWHLVEWDAREEMFKPIETVWTEDAAHPKPPPIPEGHAVPWTDRDGLDCILFCKPFPILRTPATYEGWRDSKNWQPLTAATAATTPTGQAITVHNGHIAWHPWCSKWLAIFTQRGGTSSSLGEVWLAQASDPFGPYIAAHKVLSHDRYTFYNPVLHPHFFRADSPLIYFEGSYTAEFSGNKLPTPRWDYNQVMYQLDLSKPPFTQENYTRL